MASEHAASARSPAGRLEPWPLPPATPPRTPVNPYSAAGVDTAAGDLAVELMKSAVRRTHGPEVMGGVGGFAGLFDASALRTYAHPLLATSTDGVGTKVAIAQAIDKHDTIGLDLVGMVVDDIVVVGAKPLFMTDYIACGKVFPERIADIVAGIARGCSETGTALVGGETAEHPGLLGVNDYDVAGAATGVVEADRTARRRPRARRRRRPRARLQRTALQRLLARPPHRHPRRHPVRRQRGRLRHHVGRGPARADPPLHVTAAAADQRPRRRRPRAQPCDRRRHRRQPRARPPAEHLGRGRPLDVVASAGVPRARRSRRPRARRDRGHLESRHRLPRGRGGRQGGCRGIRSPAGRHRRVAGGRRPGRRPPGCAHGDFEQGAKGVDGGAVRLVGTYSEHGAN